MSGVGDIHTHSPLDVPFCMHIMILLFHRFSRPPVNRSADVTWTHLFARRLFDAETHTYALTKHCWTFLLVSVRARSIFGRAIMWMWKSDILFFNFCFSLSYTFRGTRQRTTWSFFLCYVFRMFRFIKFKNIKIGMHSIYAPMTTSTAAEKPIVYTILKLNVFFHLFLY